MPFRRFLIPCALAGLLSIAALVGCQRTAVQPNAPPAVADAELCRRIDRALEFARAERHMSVRDQAAWQVVHGALAFGRGLVIYDPNGNLVSALDYLLAGGQLRGWTLHKGDHGLEAVLDAGSKAGQGHEDQWLGYLSLVGIPADQTIVVGNETYTVRDLLTQAQWDIYEGMEATWTLMACSTYLPLDAKWTGRNGEWTIPRIVDMEVAQDLNQSACGGTHRLVGITVALKRYLAEGGKLSETGDGTWERANDKIQEAIELAREYQQPDGSFSAQYFVRPSSSPDIATRLGTTGHTLEFLMVALDDDEIEKPWITRAATNLVGCFEKTEKFDLECGALYHAARGLALYRLRRFGALPDDSPLVPRQPAAESTAAGQ